MTLANAKVMLQEQPDFKAQRMWLVETINAFNHSVLYLPKYHCEFNFIENVWGCAKMYSRRHCDYSFEALRRIIPKAIASVSLTTIRRYARRCERYMDAYRPKLVGDSIVTLSQAQVSRAVKL